MEPARWNRVQEIFHEALERPAAERPAFLAGACADDHDLLTIVVEMLEGEARGGTVLDRDLAHLAGDVFGTGPSAPLPMTQVGRYTITERLGEGGMGVVYLAERADLGHRVAIKILRDAWVSPARRARFAIEQQTLARLDHPSIARIIDADTLVDGTPWFAMEYVEGQPITEYSGERARTVAERLRLFRDACEAVQHAHQLLIVHRDLKPSNILVTHDGVVKLLDFGIAKQLEGLEGSIGQTRAFMRLMTPAYAAPEQIRGEASSVQTDVYGLGVLLYELLTGQPRFDLAECTPAEAAALVLDHDIVHPSAANRVSSTAVSASSGDWADLDVLCLTAMHRDPARRYASVEALVRDVDRYLQGRPLEARPDSLAYRTAKFVSRNWRPLSAAVLVVATLLGLVAFYTSRLSTANASVLAEAARAARIQRFMLSLFEGNEQGAAPAADLRVVALLDRGVREARSLDGDPFVQAELYQTLGFLYQNLGNLEQADGLFASALEVRRARLASGRSDIADSLVDLGQLRIEQSRLEDAERLVREGLGEARRHLPSGHSSVAGATVALGRVLRERGNYDEATRVLVDGVRLYEALPSAEHDLGDAITALANTHFYAGRLEQSEALNRRGIAISRRLYGDRHPNVGHDLLNLVAIQSSWGRRVEAERDARAALEIFSAWYGPDHPETASAQTILSQQLILLGRHDEASGLLERALSTQRQVYGDTHPRVAFALSEIGRVALAQGDHDRAERGFTDALDIYRATNPRNFRIGAMLAYLGTVDAARGRDDRAEARFVEALATYADILPAAHPRIATARSGLGRVLVRQRRYEEGEQHLLAAYDVLSQQKDQSASALRSAREGLVEIYEALAQPEKVARFRRELAASAQKANE